MCFQNLLFNILSCTENFLSGLARYQFGKHRIKIPHVENYKSVCVTSVSLFFKTVNSVI
jgi:hypothetical protein